jgi:cyclophilin family peptidyl-prolyl cis-trans isomerase
MCEGLSSSRLGWGNVSPLLDETSMVEAHMRADNTYAFPALCDLLSPPFKVALDKITEFESKHVIFGKVLDGMRVLRAVRNSGLLPHALPASPPTLSLSRC